MKIATLNLRKGYEDTFIKESLSYSLFNDTDLIILTGYLESTKFKAHFEEVGFKYLVLSSSKLPQDGILIASRTMLSPVLSRPVTLQESSWLEVHLPKHALKIRGINIPSKTDIQSQEGFMQKVTQYAHENTTAKVIMVGNFSTPADDLGTILNFKRYFQNIASLGWIDAWRYLHPLTYEYTWFSNAKKGLCFDFVILSPVLQELLVNAYHSQIASDTKHSKQTPRALIVELM
jgi:exonuclease III